MTRLIFEAISLHAVANLYKALFVIELVALNYFVFQKENGRMLIHITMATNNKKAMTIDE